MIEFQNMALEIPLIGHMPFNALRILHRRRCRTRRCAHLLFLVQLPNRPISFVAISSGAVRAFSPNPFMSEHHLLRRSVH
jgi:hypothetical protein